MSTDASVVRSIARRYATALLDLADETGAKAATEVAADVDALGRALAASPLLRKALRNPVLARLKLKDAIATLAERLGAHGLTRHFLAVVARKGRLALLPHMLKAYRDLLSRREGRIRVEATTAFPLKPQAEKALRQSLAEAFKGAAASPSALDIELTCRPAILGGLIVRVGSHMYDMSLSRRLDKMKRAMLSP